MMAGVNPAAVQRILRHHDPRTTTETYGHLEPGYLRRKIDRLRFGPPTSEEPAQPLAVANASPFAASLLHEPSDGDPDAPTAPEETQQIPAVTLARHAGFEPATYGSGGQTRMGAPKCMRVQTA